MPRVRTGLASAPPVGLSPASDAARPKIVMFTPLPPMRNGIADYSFELLGGLAKQFDITAVAEDGLGQLHAPAGVRVISCLDYRSRWDEFAGWLHIYQVG